MQMKLDIIAYFGRFYHLSAVIVGFGAKGVGL